MTPTTNAQVTVPATQKREIDGNRAGGRVSKIYKTQYGAFWHLEALGRRRSSYLQTACGRRLGRWHLRPARPADSVPVEAICAGCIRKRTT